MIELTVPALFATGLAASPHCGLMCGALQATMLQTRGSAPLANAMFWLHAGRVSGYAGLGLAAGRIGQWLMRDLPGVGWGRGVQLLAAALLVGIGVWQLWRTSRPRTGCGRPPGVGGPFARLPAPFRLTLQGLMWAAVPCGLLYSVLGLAALSGDTMTGGVLMLAFALGTTPLLSGSGLLVLRIGSLSGLRRVGAFALIVLGVATAAAQLLNPAGAAAWCALS